MKEKTKELGNSNVLFDFYGKKPEMSQLVPLSLQHVLAAIVGVITPSMIIAGVCGLTDAEKTMMIQAALISLRWLRFYSCFRCSTRLAQHSRLSWVPASHMYRP